MTHGHVARGPSLAFTFPSHQSSSYPDKFKPARTDLLKDKVTRYTGCVCQNCFPPPPPLSASLRRCRCTGHCRGNSQLAWAIWPMPRNDAARIPVLDSGANGNDDRCVGRVNRDQRSETLLRSTVTVSESPKSCLSVVYTSDVAPRPRVVKERRPSHSQAHSTQPVTSRGFIRVAHWCRSHVKLACLVLLNCSIGAASESSDAADGAIGSHESNSATQQAPLLHVTCRC